MLKQRVLPPEHPNISESMPLGNPAVLTSMHVNMYMYMHCRLSMFKEAHELFESALSIILHRALQRHPTSSRHVLASPRERLPKVAPACEVFQLERRETTRGGKAKPALGCVDAYICTAPSCTIANCAWFTHGPTDFPLLLLLFFHLHFFFFLLLLP